jgi:stearoyl-CoA desaturase (delta-9 desaturase)
VGRRPFETKDRSRNEWIVGLLALGEGWHNNHHAFPRSALHGLRWWQVDVSGLLIRLLGRLQLVSEIQRVTAADIRIRLDRQAMNLKHVAPAAAVPHLAAVYRRGG